MSIPATFSSRPRRRVISVAPTAPGKKSKITWTGNSSKKLYAKPVYMAPVVSRYIYSESPCSTPSGLKLSATSSRQIEEILSSLQQTAQCLEREITSLASKIQALIRFSGAGELNQSGVMPFKKNSRVGINSPQDS